MEQFFVTISEPTLAAAAARANALPSSVAVELRADRFDQPLELASLQEFRASVDRPLLLTRRSRSGNGSDAGELRAALEAGFEWVDVEFTPAAAGEIPPGVPPSRVLASIHDFDGMPDLEAALRKLGAFSHVKIAATPANFADNLELLRVQRKLGSRASVFGMGPGGLYSRYLSPFLGGRPFFVAPEKESIAAPGQLTLEQALAVYGNPARSASTFFAVVGNPASHSRSPIIHNQIFRRVDLDAAYGVIETQNCEEVLDAMLKRTELAPTGLSITAPFKLPALEWALAKGQEISDRVRAAGAANTAVVLDDRMFFENTDVLGFRELITRRRQRPASVVVIGAGGTARAAGVALRELGVAFSILNRTVSSARALGAEFNVAFGGLEDASSLVPDLIIDTLPASSRWTVPRTWIRADACLLRADYSASRPDEDDLRNHGGEFVDGLQLLLVQAQAQARLFLRAADPSRDFDSISLSEVQL